MDLEATCDQMITLLTINPERVYKTAYYRKQTKNHWARDDPGFAVLQALFLMVAAVAFGVVFRLRGFWHYLWLVVHAVALHWLLFGVMAASLGRWLANGYLLQHRSHSVEQVVEWLYAFDIHCNSFFPLFILLYVVQFLLLPVLLGKSFLALILSNTLYAVAFSLYFYVSHLGYRALPFLSRTEVFLYPVGAVLLLLALTIVLHPLGLGLNMTRVMAHVYFW
ncbi:unnamed protein product [Phaeothamnion confervicola]